jgi:hypothetical protein
MACMLCNCVFLGNTHGGTCCAPDLAVVVSFLGFIQRSRAAYVYVVVYVVVVCLSYHIIVLNYIHRCIKSLLYIMNLMLYGINLNLKSTPLQGSLRRQLGVRRLRIGVRRRVHQLLLGQGLPNPRLRRDGGAGLYDVAARGWVLPPTPASAFS